MSARIHPSSSDATGHARRRAVAGAEQERRPAVYTVWKRSNMGFQGTDGFCIYDDAGNLAFFFFLFFSKACIARASLREIRVRYKTHYAVWRVTTGIAAKTHIQKAPARTVELRETY
jgi:hypothetical protein